ncbi:hypothetical protein AgCh_039936 [Apium graveolens]
MDLDPVFAAAIAGDADALAKLDLIADGALHNDDKTILHKESAKGNIEHVRFILDKFKHKDLLVKLSTRRSHTALHLAVQGKHTEVVKALIEEARNLPSSTSSSANPPISPFQAFLREVDHDKDTALHAAVYAGHFEIVKLLVEADPDDRHTKNTDGKTPMYIAAEGGYHKMVKEMCKTCPAPSLDGPGGSTALHAAIKSLSKGKFKEDVIEKVVAVAERSSSSNRSFEEFYNKTDHKTNLTVLELAVEGNHVEVVEMILQKDPAYRRGIKKNGLMLLIYKAMDMELSAMVKLLSKAYQAGITGVHKGVVTLIIAIRRRDHDMVATPFHVAAEYGHTATMIRLLQLWPSSSSVAYTTLDKKGRNILHIAAAKNKKETIQGILKYCPEPYKNTILKQQDPNNNTLLHLLIRHGCFIPELLKHKELDTMAENKDKWTPRDMLYFEADVIADQVQIKIALDEDVQTNQPWIPWHKSTKKKMDTIESIVPQTRRETKDVIFNEKTKLFMAEKRSQMEILKRKNLERYKKRTNTQIIVTALITTVTFTVGFTMPGGLRQSGEINDTSKKLVEGLAVLSKKTVFNVFMLSDALALLLSTSSLFFYFLESMTEDPHQVSKLNATSTVFNIVSVMAMMLTFMAGTFVVLSDSPTLAISFTLLLFYGLITSLICTITLSFLPPLHAYADCPDKFSIKFHHTGEFNVNPKTYVGGSIRYVDMCDIEELSLLEIGNIVDELETQEFLPSQKYDLYFLDDPSHIELEQREMNQMLEVEGLYHHFSDVEPMEEEVVLADDGGLEDEEDGSDVVSFHGDSSNMNNTDDDVGTFKSGGPKPIETDDLQTELWFSFI